MAKRCGWHRGRCTTATASRSRRRRQQNRRLCQRGTRAGCWRATSTWWWSTSRPGLLAEKPPHRDAPNLHTLAETQFGPLVLVHRLDRDTSGVLVLARTAHANRVLSAAFREHTIEKEYVAVVAAPNRLEAEGLINGAPGAGSTAPGAHDRSRQRWPRSRDAVYGHGGASLIDNWCGCGRRQAAPTSSVCTWQPCRPPS